MRLWHEIVLPDLKEFNDSESKIKSDIIFLHGTGSNAIMWKKQVEFFTRRGHKCVLIDFRGHGQSLEPEEETNPETYMHDVIETLQDSDIQFPAYFVGHSLGSLIALSIAEKHPYMVKAVFAACLPVRLVKPVQQLFRFFLRGPLQILSKSRLRQYLPWRERTLVEMPVFTMRQIAEFFSKSDLLERHPTVECPVHIGSARFDPFAIHWHTHKIHRKLPLSTFHTFEWSGHNVMDYRSEDFNQWILKNLE